jgi:hypothetical protein
LRAGFAGPGVAEGDREDAVFDGRIWVHYGQFYVFSGSAWDGDMAACFAGQTNGLLGAARPGMLFLTTGLHTGEVDLRIEILTREPEIAARWEEVVEASFVPATASVAIQDWNRATVCDLTLSPRPHRVRYSTVGMDEGRRLDTVVAASEPFEAHLLQFWPSPAGSDLILRRTGETARYWHSTLAQTRP